MAKQEKLTRMQEIVNRGLVSKLPVEKQKIVQEAIRRGMIQAPASEQTYTLGEAVVEGWKNFLPSLAQEVEAVGEQVVKHPIDTVNKLSEVATGLLHKAVPDVLTGGEHPMEATANQALETVFGKWGLTKETGFEDFKKTLAENPGALALDLSAALEGGGAVLSTAKTGGRVARTGGALRTAGQAINPINVGMEAATLPLRAVPQGVTQNAAKEFTGKIFKVRPSIRQNVRNEILEYAASGGPKGVAGGKVTGIPINPKGLERVKRRIDLINKSFDETIEAAAKRGEKISVDKVANALKRTRENIRSNPMFEKLVQQVDEAEELLRRHPMVDKKGMMAIDDARAMKSEIYRTLDGAYGEISTVADEVLKDVAHGINQQIYEAYPSLKALGQEQRVAIELNRELERAVNRLSNNNGIGLQDLAVFGGVGATTESMKLASGAGLLNKVLRMPNVRSAISKALYKANSMPFKERIDRALPKYGRGAYLTKEATQEQDAGQ